MRRTRSLLILLLLAAAIPAAASAQGPAAPVATTGAAEAITETAATLTGTIDRNGGLTTYHFEYGTTTAYGLTTPETPASANGPDPTTVEQAVSGLTRDTTYHYRLVATGPGGVSQGADRSFSTGPGPQPPGVRSTGSRDVVPRSARLITTVDPNGQATTVRFRYGRTAGYGRNTPRMDAGAGDAAVPVSYTLDGLQPNTRYHIQAEATNASGTTRSSDRTFRTPREPTGISIQLSPSRVVWGGQVSVIGRVAGSGVSGTPVALERQDFPYTSSFTQVAQRNAASRGFFRFELTGLLISTHLRAVTRTKVLAASPIVTASSAVRVSARARSRGKRRMRISGTIGPQVPAGQVRLQKRSPRGRWATVRRSGTQPSGTTRSRYAFTVTRGRKRSARFRVLVLPRDGNAHVPGRSGEVRVAPVKRR